MKLTDRSIAALKPRDERYTVWEGQAFGIRVSTRGVKTFVWLYRFAGRPRRLSLGRYPGTGLADARLKVAQARKQLEASIDPGAVKKAARQDAARNTFETVAEEWLKRDQAKNRSHTEVARVIERDVMPYWRRRSMAAITRRDCLDLIDGIADRGAETMARRVHAHLHRLFRWAVGRGILEVNPMADLPKPGRVNPRDRVLSDAELREVWRTAGVLGYSFGPIIELLIITGGRREEIGALAWTEIDAEGAAIKLEGARTKNGKPRTIPLSPVALAIVEGLPRVSPVEGSPPYLFTTTGRTPVSGWSRAKKLLDAKIAEARGEPLPAWRIHDARRTVATGLQRLGFRLEVIEAVLGHVGGSRAGIVGVYQRHSFEDEKRRALDAWAVHVTGLVEGERPAENIVPLAAGHRPA